MHRFGDQIELRVDRRHVLLFCLGGVFWTLVAFFMGMFVAGEGRQRFSEKGLVALGWLDAQAVKRKQEANAPSSVGFSFATRPAPAKRPVSDVAKMPSRPVVQRATPRAVPREPASQKLQASHQVVAPRAREPQPPPAPPAIRAVQAPDDIWQIKARAHGKYRVVLYFPIRKGSRAADKRLAYNTRNRFRKNKFKALLMAWRHPKHNNRQIYRLRLERFGSKREAMRVVRAFRAKRIKARLKALR